MTDYVELHARSAFSFLEGASLPEALIQRAAELDIPCIGRSETELMKRPRPSAAKNVKDNGIDIIAWRRSIDGYLELTI